MPESAYINIKLHRAHMNVPTVNIYIGGVFCLLLSFGRTQMQDAEFLVQALGALSLTL
jgi:hypothetical protein